MKKFLFSVLVLLFSFQLFGAVEVIETAGVWEGDRPSFIYAKISASGTGSVEAITGVAGTLVGVFVMATDDATAKIIFYDSFGTQTDKIFASEYLGLYPSTLIPTNAIGRIGFPAFYGIPIVNGLTVYAEHQIEILILYRAKP